MSDEFRQMLVRIDERTQNIADRQVEEIRERKALGDRVGLLENWRNFVVGGLAVVTFCIAAGVQYLEKKFNGH